MNKEDVIIVGGGPCGLAAAIALENQGFQPLVIEKGNIVNAVYRYPTHQTFFSTSEKLEIGDVPFVSESRKPTRNQALCYYREVVKRKQLRIHTFERVLRVEKKSEQQFIVYTQLKNGEKTTYESKHIVIATGYYDNPNYMNIPGENLHKVMHYFKEAHPYFNTEVAIIGGKNSAVDAALELHKAGAKSITVLYRGSEFSGSIKPWILPEFESLIRHGQINMEFNAIVNEITDATIIYTVNGQEKVLPNDFVFAMTGYKPDHAFLREMGVGVDVETGRPSFNPDTMETNITGIFIAGVIAAGNNANEIFIENGRFHGGLIANYLSGQQQ
ncbi:YpdA family putative bacillithiol disulfide reductase [Schinkia azotoformans]|uniref:Thioredoxin reductase n=1 Tax=Schinkia azotoformans LMG 9581 TaxID=1131731 RepID=K6C8A8_SCHAZ|nr:YpdA family putative bacillithiol disulfide reductase [Schinkia azotoformans]EKN67380.1 thioredoxin reductase [Schinkia azotoformans LMG 9581]MEC1639367.1 YpdA family putative bacillithiol disulfide reductase [Schinkia azotoformans]MEC1944379.1 YpdA family putative bacillithiol disulfide reductase [Schinkia azotoformans]